MQATHRALMPEFTCRRNNASNRCVEQRKLKKRQGQPSLAECVASHSLHASFSSKGFDPFDPHCLWDSFFFAIAQHAFHADNSPECLLMVFQIDIKAN